MTPSEYIKHFLSSVYIKFNQNTNKMGMNLNLANLFIYLSHISSFMLIFMLALMSMMGMNLIKFIVLMGALIISLAIVVYGITFNNGINTSRPAFCSMWNMLPDEYNRPTISVFTNAFLFMYLMIPMFFSGSVNWFLFCFLLFILLSDLVTKYTYNCYRLNSLVIGFFLGIIFGGIISVMLQGHETYKNLLYFSELSTGKQYCSKKTEKKFACRLYKNGQVVDIN